ncbi:hypothetical protein BDK51DRAFT_42297 [Blyttiomyces helicus]|uniref:F-box domain-containing protein n=1 Tax=Blyttiomyces helicus TaxID=388810 RepID=A0A4P9WNV1_9FUNG|nr:hypothetical protein BDK51DRAFT_42297 [Blyttiomyces helicus]|eukprot:RKO94674.1 hypothetical protein BDK51DRAFT_42297 [Blyttiomyces helicus]
MQGLRHDPVHPIHDQATGHIAEGFGEFMGARSVRRRAPTVPVSYHYRSFRIPHAAMSKFFSCYRHEEESRANLTWIGRLSGALPFDKGLIIKPALITKFRASLAETEPSETTLPGQSTQLGPDPHACSLPFPLLSPACEDSLRANYARINDLPEELCAQVMEHLDARSILRLGRTSRQWNLRSHSEHLWWTRNRVDWRFVVGNPSPSGTERKLYRSRFLALNGRGTGSIERQIQRGYALLVLAMCIHTAIFTPFKVLGLLTWPIHVICEAYIRSSVPSSSACIRLMAIDLAFAARKQMSLQGLHKFFFFNISCVVLIILDQTVLLLQWLNRALISLATFTFGMSINEIPSVQYMILLTWQLFSVPIMILVQLQIIVLPWSIVNRTTLLGHSFSIPTSVADIGQFMGVGMVLPKLYVPYLTTALLQLAYMPILCSIEETSFIFARQAAGNPVTLIKSIMLAISATTQCVAGLFSYVSFLFLVAVLEVFRKVAGKNQRERDAQGSWSWRDCGYEGLESSSSAARSTITLKSVYSLPGMTIPSFELGEPGAK